VISLGAIYLVTAALGFATAVVNLLGKYLPFLKKI